MSMTLFPNIRKTRRPSKPGVTLTIKPVALFRPTVTKRGQPETRLQFADPKKSRLGPQGNLWVLWSEAGTDIVVGEITDLLHHHTDMFGSGVLYYGTNSQCYIDTINDPLTPVYVVPRVYYEERHVTQNALGERTVTNWALESVTLTTDPKEAMWQFASDTDVKIVSS